MAIVINDFEVEPGEAEPSPTPRVASQNEPGTTKPPSPWEIERMVEQQLERSARVWAH